MNRLLLILSIGAFALLGCSGDDEAVVNTPDGGDAGGEGGAGGAGGQGGESGEGGTAAMSGEGGSGGMNAGTGGTDPDDDGGVDPVDAGGDAGEPAQPLPDDGNQGSVCEDGTDCNQDLDCYNAGTDGQGFCSATCEMDDDCTAIAGAAYVCSMSTGVCIVECEGEDDEESCPDGMACVNTSGFGGGGMASYRCKYPDAPPAAGTAQAFEACSMEEPCAAGLVCNAAFGGAGYCTASCTPPDGDCDAVADAAGDLTAECTTALGGPGGAMGRCTLDCSDDEEGCPDGLTCIDMGGPMGGVQRCGVDQEEMP
jgi:hypothetical protein